VSTSQSKHIFKCRWNKFDFETLSFITSSEDRSCSVGATVLDLLAFCAFVTAADAEPAKKKQESGKKHQHKNGHNLLGAKVRQNGPTPD